MSPTPKRAKLGVATRNSPAPAPMSHFADLLLEGLKSSIHAVAFNGPWLWSDFCPTQEGSPCVILALLPMAGTSYSP
jgi:hypothetical protein